jgi:hypothetical protein
VALLAVSRSLTWSRLRSLRASLASFTRACGRKGKGKGKGKGKEPHGGGHAEEATRVQRGGGAGPKRTDRTHSVHSSSRSPARWGPPGPTFSSLARAVAVPRNSSASAAAAASSSATCAVNAMT